MDRDILNSLTFQDGIVMGVLIWTVTLCLVALFVIVLYGIGLAGVWAYDKITLEEHGPYTSECHIVSRDYEEPHTTFVYNAALKMTQPIYHPAQHNVTIYVNSIKQEFRVDNEELFKRDVENISPCSYLDLQRRGKHVKFELKQWEAK
jgi:hypothetical protein